MLHNRILSALGLAMGLGLVSGQQAIACDHGRPIRYIQSAAPVQVVERVVYQPTITPAYATQATMTQVIAKPVITVTQRSDLPELPVGSIVTARANFLGPEPGHVLLHFGSATMECETLAWTTSSVRFRLPELGLKQRTPATVQIVLPTGRIAKSMQATLTNSASLIVESAGIDTEEAPSVSQVPVEAETNSLSVR